MISAVVVAVSFYVLNVFIADFQTIRYFYSSLGFFGSLKFFVTLSLGFSQTILLHSFITVVVSSVMLGMLFSIVSYKVSIQGKNVVSISKKSGVFGSIGVFLATLAPGCAACGVGLAAVLGVSGSFISYSDKYSLLSRLNNPKVTN